MLVEDVENTVWDLSGLPSPVVGTATTPSDFHEDPRMEEASHPGPDRVITNPRPPTADVEMAPPPPLAPPPPPPPAFNLIPPTPHNSQESADPAAQIPLQPLDPVLIRPMSPPATAITPPPFSPHSHRQFGWGRSRPPLVSELAAELRAELALNSLSPTDGPMTRAWSRSKTPA